MTFTEQSRRKFLHLAGGGIALSTLTVGTVTAESGWTADLDSVVGTNGDGVADIRSADPIAPGELGINLDAENLTGKPVEVRIEYSDPDNSTDRDIITVWPDSDPDGRSSFGGGGFHLQERFAEDSDLVDDMNSKNATVELDTEKHSPELAGTIHPR